MEYIYGFIFVGTLCLIGQLIMDKTKLTPGHITSIYVVLGAVLGFFGIYEWLSLRIGPAVSLPITSFGNQLYNSAYSGYLQEGYLGLVSNMLSTTSAGIVSTIIVAFFVAIVFKPKQ